MAAGAPSRVRRGASWRPSPHSTIVSMTSTRVSVLVCDDHELVRRGLTDLLKSDLTVDVVGTAGTADEAVRAVAELAPDVVIMDVRMPGRSGIEACRDIRAAHNWAASLVAVMIAVLQTPEIWLAVVWTAMALIFATVGRFAKFREFSLQACVLE